MTDEPSTDSAPGTPPAGSAPAPRPARRRSSGRPAQPRKAEAATAPTAQQGQVHPVLEQLAALYPRLFGAVFLPLKRGIFQDLMAAHPELLEKEPLKEALARHTRCTRYLTVMASGQQRHDLQGQAVEAVAPEHVHLALLEVFRRRQGRAGITEDLRPKLVGRILQALEASGLSREAYAQRVRGRDEAANAVLDEALAEAAVRAAKDEALLGAFTSSGQETVQAFADMYGMDAHTVARSLERARRSLSVAAKED